MSRKAAVNDPEFIERHRAQADYWIKSCKPVTWGTQKVVPTLTTQQAEKLNTVFDRHDPGDGRVPVSELGDMVTQAGMFASKACITSMMCQAGVEKDGYLELEAFLMLMATKIKDKREREQLRLDKSKDDRERVNMLRHMEPLPFEEWFTEIKGIEELAKQKRGKPELQRATTMTPSPEMMAKSLLKDLKDAGKLEGVSHVGGEVAMQVALAKLKRTWGREKDHPKEFESLVAEVRSGLCTLTETDDGIILRVVHLGLVHLENRHSCILTELGSLVNGKAVPLCRLPGKKHPAYEKTEEAMKKFLRSMLAQIADGVKLGHIETVEEHDKSRAYGIQTKFVKAIQYAFMDVNFELPELPQATLKKTSDVPEFASKYKVFMLMHHEGLRFYTWLKKEDYEYLYSKKGKAMQELRDWLNALQVDEAEAKRWLGEVKHDHEEAMARRPRLTENLSRERKSGKPGHFFEDFRSKWKASNTPREHAGHGRGTKTYERRGTRLVPKLKSFVGVAQNAHKFISAPPLSPTADARGARS